MTAHRGGAPALLALLLVLSMAMLAPVVTADDYDWKWKQGRASFCELWLRVAPLVIAPASPESARCGGAAEVALLAAAGR